MAGLGVSCTHRSKYVDRTRINYHALTKRDSLTVSALASYAADPGSNPGVSTKMEHSIFGYGCVGYENDCGKIERSDAES